MTGIVLINKPIGITSYDVIRKAKKIFNTKKIGHTGTLDPFASGLLLLCVGSSTKLVTKLIESDKVYEGIIKFNTHTDTFDLTGNVLYKDDKKISIDDLNTIRDRFIGKLKQYPPMYSAVRVDGKRLYDYARNNKEVNLKERNVEVYSLEFSETSIYNEFYFKTHVSKGTYIRTLAVDIAKELDTFAHLTKLNRIELDKYHINNSVELDNLETNHLIDLESIYKDSPKIEVSEYLTKLVKNGIRLDERQIKTNQEFRVYSNLGNLIAIYEPVEEFVYRPLVIV